MKICPNCEAEFEPYLINETFCIDCSIEMNDHIVNLNTDMQGNCKNKKLLRRRYQLRELRPVTHHKDADRINMVCKGCGETFLTYASFKDRFNYCKYCQKLRNNLSSGVY